MKTSVRYFVEIQLSKDRYIASIHHGNPNVAISLPELKLGKEVEISIKGHSYSLGSLIQALVDYHESVLENVFDERGQLEIGTYLYNQLFGKLSHHHNDADDVEVRIITKDEHISGLPWILLANKGVFLSTAGWSIILSSHSDICDYELPPSPRMLVIAPQPLNVAKTRAENHLEVLGNLLSRADHRLLFGSHLKLATTWEEFTRLIKEFEPQIVYYYGHGQGNIHKGALLFATGTDKQCKDVPIANFALCLRHMTSKPCLVYINCCQGNAAGFLGAGMQLEDFIPAVVTNRTVARIDTAQEQAIRFWESVLLKGIPPHKAVANLYSDMNALDLSVDNVRWMNPVFHCHYDTWRSNPPTPANRLVHDPHWHLKIDRVAQFAKVSHYTREMLRERKPRSFAFVWYGEEGQGIEIFHQRLNVDIRRDLPNTHLYEVRPEWPMEFHNVNRSFSDMLTEAFEVNSMTDIPARIRTETHGRFGTQTLVYMRHIPVTSPKLINPRRLREYLEWWDAEFVSLLEPQQFALLGISFVVKKPPTFRKCIIDKERLNDLYLDKTVFRLLDKMERIARTDLLDFLRTHNIHLPIKRRDKVLEVILEKTGGHYEKTVEELKHLLERAWDLSEEDGQKNEELQEKYDY